jgi:hypothetical protein
MTYFVVSTIALAFAVGFLGWHVFDLRRRMEWLDALTLPKKRKKSRGRR